MATKIRCSECRKKISVDEAFAGSMCRCPYCKAIVMVPKPGDSSSKPAGTSRPSTPTAGRPASPTSRSGVADSSGLKNVIGARPIIKEGDEAAQTPDGPKSPDSKRAAMSMERLLEIPLAPPPSAPRAKVPGGGAVAVDTSRFSAEQLAAIPMANPVLFQGIVSLVLIVIMLLMTAGCVYLGVRIFSKSDIPVDDTLNNGEFIPQGPKNPFTLGASSPVICGDVQIDTPVVYCIDAGSNMGDDIYPLARAVMSASIISLGDSRKFGAVVLQEDRTELIGGEMLSGGWGGYGAIKTQTHPTDRPGGKVTVGGATDLMLGIQKALSCKPKPKTIVLIVSCRYIEDPKVIAAVIKKSGARLVLVVLGIDNEEQVRAANVLLKEAGGNSQSVIYDTKDELADMYSNSAVPE